MEKNKYVTNLFININESYENYITTSYFFVHRVLQPVLFVSE